MMTAYLAPEGFLSHLLAELRKQGRAFDIYDQLVIAKGERQPVYWTQNTWYDPQLLNISSIGDAVRQLKALQRNWWPYAYQLHRRTNLIHKQLPKVKVEPLTFGSEAVLPAALGSFCLLDEKTILAASQCSSRFPNGTPVFNECKVGPPSRAYLKLWEAFVRLGRQPKAGERCLELGASPGGWTWVVAKHGADVVAIDRAPLAPNIAAMKNVTFQEGDAFAAKPERIGPLDWLFSDVICYPEKLYDFVQLWLQAGTCKNFICTLKFQGDEHYGIIRAFAAIPGSRVLHLTQNKHELTWICCPAATDLINLA